MAKSARKSIEVKPDKKGWSVRGGEATQGSGRYSSKREATTVARRIAREKNLDVIIYEPGRQFTEIRTSNLKPAPDVKTSESRKKTVGSVSSISERQKSAPQIKAELWKEWAAGHKNDFPALSDEAISREGIYGDRG